MWRDTAATTAAAAAATPGTAAWCRELSLAFSSLVTRLLFASVLLLPLLQG